MADCNGTRSAQASGEALVTVLTAPRSSALAVVAVAGTAARAIVQSCLRRAGPLARADSRGVATARWHDGEVVVVRARPRDFAVPYYEISCHGGARIWHVLGDLANAGAVRASPETFLERIYGATIAREVAVCLPRANTADAAAALLAQPSVWDHFARALLNDLRGRRLDAVRSKLAHVLEYAPIAQHYTTPWKVAVVGRPNVGKSSLLNALAGFQRAIVHDAPGTTRDLVTESIAYLGWVFEIQDTAGVRDPADEIEAQGIQRARRATRTADLIWLVVDGSVPPEPSDHVLVRTYPQAILVVNKTDLPQHPLLERLVQDRSAAVFVSARFSLGLDELLQASLMKLLGAVQPPDAKHAVAFSPEVVRWCRELQDFLERGAIEAAVGLIESRFCSGTAVTRWDDLPQPSASTGPS